MKKKKRLESKSKNKKTTKGKSMEPIIVNMSNSPQIPILKECSMRIVMDPP